MLRIDTGGTGRYCDGMSRRSFVQLGVAGMASVGLADVLKARAMSTTSSGATGKAESAILIWLDGGPGHMDLYDMKPEAPPEIRGIWRPIRTNVPGIEISELFPKQARVAEKFSLVRSLHHDQGGHFAGGHQMLTAHPLGSGRPGKFPSFGSIATRHLGARQPGIPSYVSVPVASSIGLRPGYFGGNWLGKQFDPFQTGGDPNKEDFKVQNLDLVAGLSLDRLEDRSTLNRELDALARHTDASGAFEAFDRFHHDAFEFVCGDRARTAFDINQEDAKIRDSYGRHNWGQSTLLARRIVEAGARFVTVHFGGWDHHWSLQSGMENFLPRVDDSVSGLLNDLDNRGMLDSTLVILCGEFSRTPRMNNGHNKGTPGRDHWGNSMFCLLAGGGVKGGQIVGSTDENGYRPASRPLRPHHIHATIYHALGMDPALHLLDHRGRPTPVLEDPTPIAELI